MGLQSETSRVWNCVCCLVRALVSLVIAAVEFVADRVWKRQGQQQEQRQRQHEVCEDESREFRERCIELNSSSRRRAVIRQNLRREPGYE